MANKIGILTHYTNNRNYGGLLQAYALCRFLNGHGNNAEQIRFYGESRYLTDSNIVTQKGLVKFIKKKRSLLHVFIYAMLDGKRRRVWFQQKKRIKKTRAFELSIPHSKKKYTADTICDTEKIYDIFITGSDQVWNPKWYKSAYFLDFVSSSPKISYAASISQNQLTDFQKDVFREQLSDYLAISVREAEGKELLDEILSSPVEWVLDPTLLLTRDEWDEVCTERKISDKYLFCYFLGDDSAARECAKEYALRKGLRLVSLPHIFGSYRECDEGFGDVQLFCISPEDFVSLVKYAEYIFTDSFHACVFSVIYEKQYCVFERDASNEMGSRLYSFTRIFGHESRYLDSKEKSSLSHVERLPDLDYSYDTDTFVQMKKKSVSYLLNSIKKAEVDKLNHESKPD